ncbi:trissin receptor [Neocloeon triangulifer]|uniref:trissin receptor n=1 Tax=Neocloeon triangulifer TaxID=2078957 RepID=UPI00286F45D6|nr:trissin receptor [Neocloeon triangulifer]
MDGEKWSGSNDSGNTTGGPWWHDYDEGEQYIFHRNDVFYSFLTAYLLVAVLAVFGNFLVILVVQCDRQVESKTNFLLGQLAVADLCVGVFCVMQSFMAYLSNWSLGLFMCQMYLYVQALSYVASVLIMVAVCVERYVAIMQPFHTRSVFTTARLRLIIVLVWLVSAAYASPRLFFARVTSQELRNDETDTFCHLDTTRYDPEIFDTANLIFLYVIPLLVMAIMYSRMCVELWQSGRQIPGAVHAGRVPCNPSVAAVPDAPSALTTTSLLHLVPEPGEHAALQPCMSIPDNQSVTSEIVQGGSRSPLPSPVPPLQRMSSLPPLRETRDPLRPCNSPRPKRRERKMWRRFFHKRSQSRRSNDLEVGPLGARRRVVYMLILVVLSFLLCNLPYHARKMWQVRLLSAENMVYYQLFTPCTFLIMYFNSALNPILYATMSLSFRRAMRRRVRLIFRGAIELCRRRPRQGSPTLLVRGTGKAASSSTRSSTRAANNVVHQPLVATNGQAQPETGV